MKNLRNLSMLIALFVANLAFAQKQSGTIYFTETLKLDIKLPEGMKVPKELMDGQKTEKVLYFNDSESFYANAKTQATEEKITSGSEDAVITVKRSQADNRLYKNLENNQKKESRDIFGKVFLIEDELITYEWKLTGKQKVILGYACQQATYTNEEDTVEAWFTQHIPVATGPENYGQLPGMILEVSLNNGRRVVTANKVELGEYDEKALTAPTKGKKVSQAKFDEIREAKIKQMREMYGGGEGGVIIKTIEN